MSLNLSTELSDAARAIGLLKPNGEVDTGWFGAPDTALSHILSNPGQRAAFLDLPHPRTGERLSFRALE